MYIYSSDEAKSIYIYTARLDPLFNSISLVTGQASTSKKVTLSLYSFYVDFIKAFA